MLDGISGHADKNGLIKWLKTFKKKPEIVFVNHGEEKSCDEFTDCIRNEYGYNSVAPYSGTCYDLLTGEVVVQTYGIRVQKKNYKTCCDCIRQTYCRGGKIACSCKRFGKVR